LKSDKELKPFACHCAGKIIYDGNHW